MTDADKIPGLGKKARESDDLVARDSDKRILWIVFDYPLPSEAKSSPGRYSSSPAISPRSGTPGHLLVMQAAARAHPAGREGAAAVGAFLARLLPGALAPPARFALRARGNRRHELIRQEIPAGIDVEYGLQQAGLFLRFHRPPPYGQFVDVPIISQALPALDKGRERAYHLLISVSLPCL